MGPLVEGVRRIAVLRANAIGDYCFALPALDALRAAYPDAEIVLVGRAWHAQFLPGRPGPIDRVVVVPGDAAPEAAAGERLGDAPWLAAEPDEREAFGRMMVAERYDLAIQLHGGGRNSNPIVASFGARTTVGLRTPDAPPLDRWIRYVYFQHEVLRCLEVVALVGASPVTVEARVPASDADRAESRALLGVDDGPYAVLHPGAVDARRRWPTDRFAVVGDALSAGGLRVVLTGSAGEARLTDAVRRAMDCPALDLAGRSSIGGLAGILAGAAIVVSNDSGPLHLAGALGAPTVGIYWCGNVLNGGPLTRGRHRPVIAWEVCCPICRVDCTRADCEHQASFVASVPVERVLEEARDLLAAAG